MDIDKSLNWINAEMGLSRKEKPEHKGGKKSKGHMDRVTDQIVRSLW